MIYNNKTQNNVSIVISLNNETFKEYEYIYLTINITNKGSNIIHGEGYCYSIKIKHPNETIIEYSVAVNASVGDIEPNETYNIFDVLQGTYSNNPINPMLWNKIRYLSPGEYTIWAVYNSKGNYHNEYYKFPYGEVESNKLTFRII